MSSNSQPAPSADNNGAPSTRSEGNRNPGRRKDRRHNASKRTNKFRGKCEDLKDAIYEISSTGGDSFTKTNREVAEYVGRTITGGGEFRTAMIDLQLDPLIEPAPPDQPDAVDFPIRFDIWREDRKLWLRRVEDRRKVMEQIFPTVLGQCDPAVRARIEASENWNDINTTNDVIGMLRLIRNCEVQRQTRRDETSTLLDAERSVMNFRQNALPDSEYYQSFKDKIETADQLGAAIGEKPDLIAAKLGTVAADPDFPTDAERATAASAVKDAYLARLFLINSDKKRYASLIRDIENDFTRGNDTYPDSLSSAYDFIVNYVAPRTSSRHPDDSGMAYAQEHDDAAGEQGQQESRPNQPNGRGPGRGYNRGGRDGRGGGNSRGGRSQGSGRGGRTSGRGRGRDNDRQLGSEPQDGNAHNQDGVNDGSDAQFLLDNLDESADYYLLPSNIGNIVAIAATDTKQDISKMLVLDSASTLNMVCDPNLLHDIHDVPVGIKVRCNAGQVTITRQGYLGDFPEPVWLHTEGVVNILSFYIVQRHYHVQYDNRIKDAFLVTGPNGIKVPFRPVGKGLYACGTFPGDASADAWAFISMVDERKKEYTKREYRDAMLARRVQNIIMFPSIRTYNKIVDSNLLTNCPVTRHDISAADHILGKNISALKGKTVYRQGTQVSGRTEGVPRGIQSRFQRAVLAVDIMFVNKIPFLVTISKGLRFGTSEVLKNRHASTVAKAIENVLRVYRRRGFRVTECKADMEFEPVQNLFQGTTFNLCAEDEHVPEIERYIRTVKDRSRSGYNSLPFERIPRLVVVRLVGNSVFWLNAFPHEDGVSDTLSPRYLITGRHLDYRKHVRLEFGAYVQTHEKHTNGMERRTCGAICLGPTGNEQGGHYFMSLATGLRLIRNRWDELPMPRDAITRVGELGRRQGMPKSLTFADRFGHEILDDSDDVDDDHDSDYDPNDDSDQTSVSSGSYASSTSSSNDSDDSDDDDDDSNGQPMSRLPAGVGGKAREDSDSDDDDTEDDDEVDSEDSDSDDDDTYDKRSNARKVTINVKDEVISSPEPNEPTGVGVQDEPTGVGVQDEVRQSTGVGRSHNNLLPEITGVRSRHSDEDSAVEDNTSRIPSIDNAVPDSSDDETEENTVTHDGNPAENEMNTRYGPRNREGLRERKPRSYSHRFGFDHSLATFEQPMGELFLTEQMNVKKGLKVFGESGAEAVVKELKQLDRLNTIEPRHSSDMTRQQRQQALRYLMYLKQKRCGRIKARGCADGRKQRLYKTKDETSSPTVSTEALFLTSAINAHERRKVVTIDIPGAFMQCDIDELIFVKLEGAMALLLVKMDPIKYEPFLTYEHDKPVLYVKLLKALYGTLQAALLFWENLSGLLVDELGFTANPYDPCVVNKIINGKQCTALWHVDDIKMSHVEQDVLESIITKLSDRYGQDAPLTVQRGPIHKYLGMTIDYSEDGKVKFIMDDYVKGILDEAPSDMDGTATSPAANHLFSVNEKSDKIDTKKADLYHRLTAKLLYLSKRARPDFLTAVSFLTTRVTQPDVDDWKKLGRAIKFLRKTQDLWLTLEVDKELCIRWWIDASFGVHPDKRSHTGATMSLGKGSPISSSTKQKLNTRSSTEAELVGVDDSMALVVWSRNFLQAQGLEVTDNIVYQDNQSAMLLERNGRASSGRRTRHIDIRYYFVTDRIKKGDLRVEYCNTDDMTGDFFTKPVQGSKFRKFQGIVLNLPPEKSDNRSTAAQECVGKRSYADVVRTGVSHNPMTHAAVPFTDLTNKTTADNKLSLLSAN